MALLDTAAIGDGPQLRRAMLLLSYLGHAYVWGETSPAERIPRPLAVSWHRIAVRLGRPPVLSYASYALDNWRRLDSDGPIALGNIAILQNFLGGADEDWFIAVHIDIEAKAARLLSAIGPALPRGMVYEGVEAYGGAPQQLRGETGAQSGIVPVVDALLGVVHADDPLRTYLAEMRAYMPPGHRLFLEEVEGAPPLRAFVVKVAPGDRPLREAYNACLHWLDQFRSLHLEIAGSYIHHQAQATEGNPTATRTGGTPFMRYLRKHRDETAAHRL